MSGKKTKKLLIKGKPLSRKSGGKGFDPRKTSEPTATAEVPSFEEQARNLSPRIVGEIPPWDDEEEHD